MNQKPLLAFLCMILLLPAFSQRKSGLSADAWVDSVFRSLSQDEKIAQLMVVRLSTINSSTRVVTFYEQQVEDAVRKYNIGGICLFQGPPVKQATLINHYQAIAKTPVLMTIDGENGLGMRLDSVAGLPRQMMLGAVQDPGLIYRYGRWVGQQCRRMGIQVNYAPVVDVNNNPDNPVINDRSFGENKEKVARYAIEYMKGMRDMGIMGSAKHFPGHGDVSVDSHYDLPVINKTRAQLDSLELYPFRELIREGVGSVMVAHLSVPAIDNTANRASSISYRNVTELLRNELGFQGLTFTDALEMKGVTKYFPDGQASVEALIAGHDMLCLPGDIPSVLTKVKDAIRKKRLGWESIDARVRKVLRAKYDLGLANAGAVDLRKLTEDLNRESPALRRSIAEAAITLASHDDPGIFPLPVSKSARVALVSVGTSTDNAFSRRMRLDHNADVFHFDYRRSASEMASLLEILRKRYDAVVVGIHGLTRFPGKNFGMSDAGLELVRKAAAQKPSAVVLFGNPYAARNFCSVRNLLVCYEDEPVVHDVAADILSGKILPRGKLPVGICDRLPAGTGITTTLLPSVSPELVGISENGLKSVDSLAEDAIRQHATPGCVVLVARKGRIVFHKAYGHMSYDSTRPMTKETLFDMASVTKICATTISVMKLHDEGRLDLDKTLGDYLEWVKGSDKEGLRIRDILLHQAGLKAFIPFYRETMDTLTGIPREGFYSSAKNDGYETRVTDNMYLKNSFSDTIYKRILQSPVDRSGNYVYSDNDFIFLGKIVEAISGMGLEEYVHREFYRPMGLVSAGFRPLDRFPRDQIAPTEEEKIFRRQLIHGHVHDPGAALFGGVAGHAGLFSSAYDIAVIMQMLLNKGEMNGRRYLSDTTIEKFTVWQSDISRRGLGFDKPEKDNLTRKDPYPALSVSSGTFGHTGFTGTCAWADPKEDLVFVFLSNRVHPDGSNKLGKMNVRGNIHEQVYRSLK
jgi:beta-glucosidase-like glycosyl hydrolase/CubicO group peptidase (beta-lactamase class C family)